MSWAGLEQYRPSALLDALSQIEAQHKRAAVLNDSERESRLERVRELLRQTPLERIPSLRTRLSRRDFFVLPDIVAIETDDTIQERAVRLAVIVRTKEIPKRSWKLVVSRGPLRALHQVLQGYADQAELLVQRDVDALRVERWLRAESLEAGLLADREESRASSVDSWQYALPVLEPPLEPESAVWPAFWKEFVANASGDALRAEDEASLIARAESLGESAVDGFIVNYLRRLRPGRHWSPKVVDWAIQSRGRPKADSIVGVWRRAEEADPGVMVELLSWLALRTLESFFRSVADPHGRFEFWKKNFGHILLEAYRLCGGAAAALVFPGVVVVEFGEKGNAAYVYPDSELSWVRRSIASEPADVKDRFRLIRTRVGEFRIIHKERWQPSARERMKEAIESQRAR